MFVEFVGLPASGKTTLMLHLIQYLNDHDISARHLTNVAQQRMQNAPKTNRFIRRRSERTSMYGCIEFANANPELFALLANFPADDPKMIHYNMDFVADLHYAKNVLEGPEIIMTDEGLIHRGIASFNGRDDVDVFDDYIAKIPSQTVCVYLHFPVRAALRRSVNQRGKLPYQKSFNGRDPVDILHETHRLTDRAIDQCRANGITVLRLDARATVDDLVTKAADLLMADLEDQLVANA